MSSTLNSKTITSHTHYWRHDAYPGFPHGMCSTHKDVVNADLLAFLKGEKTAAA
jgi:hypothetical protein